MTNSLNVIYHLASLQLRCLWSLTLTSLCSVATYEFSLCTIAATIILLFICCVVKFGGAGGSAGGTCLLCCAEQLNTFSSSTSGRRGILFAGGALVPSTFSIS